MYFLLIIELYYGIILGVKNERGKRDADAT